MSFRGDGGSESGGDRVGGFDPLGQAQSRMVDEYLDYLAANSNAGLWQNYVSTADLSESGSFGQFGDVQSAPQTGLQADLKPDEEAAQQQWRGEATALAFFDPASKELDPNKPTLLVFDNFSGRRQPGWPNAGGEAVSVRGDVSAEEAEKQGFNVVRIGSTADDPALDKALPELADKIDNGDLALGQGDIVNINAESNISFKSASELIGFTITADNVKDMVPDMLQRMRELAEDPRQDAATSIWLKQMLAVNDAARRIADKGIEVVASAGTDGPDKFNIAALTATTQLALRTESGVLSTLSAKNSLIAQLEDGGQQGQSESDHGAQLDPKRPSDRDRDVRWAARDDALLHRSDIREQYVIGWARGTSFANVDYFVKNFERLKLLKNSA